MRILPISLLAVLLGSSAFAQQTNTDVTLDGLSGPVKSVASAVTQSGLKWQQPSGPTMVTPIWCRDCEYDPDGWKTKSGTAVEGKFYGENIELRRDSSGNVVERFFRDASTGELHHREKIGPFGKTEQWVYMNGKLYSVSKFTYDERGHVTEWLSLDPSGKQVDRSIARTLEDGTVTERAVYGKNDQLTWQQTFDPETRMEHFTTFDDQGKMKLQWIASDGKLISFWETAHGASQFGDNFTEPAEEGTVVSYHCHADLTCEQSKVHYEFLNGNKHNPLSAEWRDSDGNLQLAAYFDYVVDSFGNWTQRKVWVWDPSMAQRGLYETDLRTITYWTK